ncbi:hypothetical protein SD457_19670 [Coprobacillaceae bacterium CR2/5/TPMF4]|nr:hypothetical protein SD457_19670 [Coprobacillaceae bacterium CR2/5/TPMF4]
MNEDEVIKELGITQKSLQKYKEAGLIRLVKMKIRVVYIIMKILDY